MNIENQIFVAEKMARSFHDGQFRRNGITPYVTHPEAVAKMVSEKAKPAAWLHDVLEDATDKREAEEALRKNFSEHPEIIEAVYLLTKCPEDKDNYFRYIERVAKNEIAREVKLWDIVHNMASNPKPENVDKYFLALLKLGGKKFDYREELILCAASFGTEGCVGTAKEILSQIVKHELSK